MLFLLQHAGAIEELYKVVRLGHLPVVAPPLNL